MLAPTAPALPRCFIGVEGTSNRLMKPRNMHTALQNDGAMVRFTALHTAARPSASLSQRMRFQLNVRNTIGESVITNTMVDRLAVNGPIGMWVAWVTISVAAPESAPATKAPNRIHGERKMTSSNTPKMPAAADRKSTRLNSSHVSSSYAVFCLQK